MNFIEKLIKRENKVKSLVCVGLDSDPKKVEDQFEFNQRIIDVTCDLVLAYKPNLAFYEANGIQGWKALTETMKYLRTNYPDIVTIADAKRADIGSTNEGYVTAIFDELGFDAVTLHPYLGQEALAPFLKRKDKGCIILCRTSNPGAGEFQDLMIEEKPFWHRIAESVSKKWNQNRNCLLVVGATYPKELEEVRKIVGDMWLLVPGIGVQGGDLNQVLERGLTAKKTGLMINSSRGIIFAKNPREETEKLRDLINAYRFGK